LTLPEQLVWAAVFGAYYDRNITAPIAGQDGRELITRMAARRATTAVADLRRVARLADEMHASEPEVAEAVREMAG
jgi:hypothetical protein